MNPGCKADCLLVLEGEQGTFKSTATEVLAGKQWWTDQLTELGSKDASMQLRGTWIVEFGELDQLTRAEVTRMKHFISSKEERFRLPYGKRVVRFPRQCVFIGTTNTDQWLKDETGGRRFWPVRVGQVDVERISADRDQLWAEAVHQYRSGATWWLDDPDVVAAATEEQGGRYAEDVWHEQVIEHAEQLADFAAGSRAGTVSVSEILMALNIDLQRQDQIASNRVGRCLTRAGWRRKRVGSGKDREWRYKRPA
jgi:predicted P-loop ATPase